MLNPNTRANTVISQSFIESQFQGFTDPFLNSKPTSSLNQFVRSKQTSDSGFIEGEQNHSYGFGNITTNHELRQLQSFSRKAHEVVHVNGVANPNYQNQNLNQIQNLSQNNPNQNLNQIQKRNQNNQSSPQHLNQANLTQVNYSNQQKARVIPPLEPRQQTFHEKTTSPVMVKTESPAKMNQFVPPQQKSGVFQQQQKPVVNAQQINNQLTQTHRRSTQQQQSQVVNNRQQSTFQKQLLIKNNPNSSKETIQGSKKLNSSQQRMMSSNVSQSSIGKRLKLNVSQQFSDSFTLDCVNQPQRTTILQMKKRQRQYRKATQNFFM